MNRIHLLPEHVANQIAAGEVVERPASVVKELVENSLDAQAARVTVEVQAGGRSLIRVLDDGLGMSRDDALLCLERHATSKIQRAEDLSAVTTMGFRGEALPSIASVSRFSLTTRERGAENPAATQVIIQGGKIVEVKEAGAPGGTSIEVRQLFFNLPARRKFLRSEETEYAHINHYLTLAALAHPQVAFTFIKDGRPMWQLAAVPTAPSVEARIAALRERMRALFGDEQKLLPIDFSAELPAPAVEASEKFHPGDSAPLPPPASHYFRLWGLIGAPGVSRSSRENQHVFVNRRPVENRGLNFALDEGYHTALMKGRYPVCCLFVEIEPSLVDVNIHPAKREVKFHNERAVRELTAQAIRETLLRFHGTTPAAPTAPPPPVAKPAFAPVAPAVPAPATKEFPQFTPLTGTPLAASESVISKPVISVRPNVIPLPAPTDSLKTDSLITLPTPPVPTVERAAAQAPTGPVPLLGIPLRLVGVVGRLYVVLESDRGLVLMDQHAATSACSSSRCSRGLRAATCPSNASCCLRPSSCP